MFPRLLLFLLAFSSILVYSLSPGVYAGDSGLFIAASYFLGSTHSPAYPLFVSLGKLFTFVPFGNIAFKVNLLAAFCGALTALITYETVFYITKNYVISLFTFPVLLASRYFILESSQAKGVYALSSFLVMVIFYLGLRAIQEKDFFKKILLSFFVLGLGMGNHHTIGFMLFPLLFVILIKRKELPFGTIALSLIFFLAGFSVYLYLYLRAQADAFINYSQVRSLLDFISIFIRAGYSGNTLDALQSSAYHAAGWLYAIKNIGTLISREIHPLVLIFALIGIYGFFRDKKICGYVLISLAVWLPLAKITISAEHPTNINFEIITPYFIQIIPMVAVVATCGLYKCYEAIKRRSLFISKSFVAGLMITQILFVLISIQKISLSEYYVAYSWAKDVSKVLKPKSFYMAYGDNPAFLFFYVFGVERLRDDVLCLDSIPGYNTFRTTISPEWKFEKFYPDFYETNVKYLQPFAREGRLFASASSSIPENIGRNFAMRKYVLIYILLPKDNNFPLKENFENDFKKIDYYPVLARSDPDFLAEEIVKRYALALWMYADLMAEKNSRDTDYYYRLAAFVANSEMKNMILTDYIRFLFAKRGADTAERFISELKNAASNKEGKQAIEKIVKDVKGNGI
jgi:hypothetical protein